MIIGKRVLLRAIELDDLPLLTRWRNDPEVYEHFYEHEPLSLTMQRRWFDGFLQRQNEKYWLVETVVNPEPIGTVGLVNIDWRNRRAELGRVLIASGKFRHGGYGQEACELALGYAYGHLNLHRVYLDVFADNTPAVKFYRRLRFSEEGRLRQHVFAKGQYRDVLVFSLLASEFRALPSSGPGA